MKRWYREPKGALVAGVSTGLAASFGCPVWLVRMCWVLAALISLKVAILAYLILALVLPSERHEADKREESLQPFSRVQQLEEEFRELEKRLGS